MTKEQIVTPPTRDLQAIVRSTNPAGRSWLECQYPHDGLAQRPGAAR